MIPARYVKSAAPGTPWIPAEIYAPDLAAMRLVPDDGEPSVLLCADLRGGGFVPVFVPRGDVARLLFASWTQEPARYEVAP